MTYDNGQPYDGQRTGSGEQDERIGGAPQPAGHTGPEAEGDGAMDGRGEEGSDDGAPQPGPPQQGDQERPDADYDNRGYG